MHEFMSEVLSALSPYLADLAVAAVGVLATLAAVALRKLQAKVSALLDARLTESQRALLHVIATEAYAYAEAEFKAADGPDKMGAALRYASGKLSQAGVNVSADDIRSAIHKAWIDVGGHVKPEQSAGGNIKEAK